MFTWTPLYKELAKTLLAYKDRQPELVAILNEIKNSTGIPTIRLVDAPQPASTPILTEIDPFTFFADFNRGLTNQNRMGIIKILKEKFQLVSELPTDLNGIPVVDSQRSWFFPYGFSRKADDIPSLWNLAESAIAKKPEELDPKLFDRCLEIEMVGPAKLTMGMFWLNPDFYLALDEKNTNYFASAGITTKVTDHASYISLLHQVREKLGTDFTHISRSAWETATQEIQYWAGGSTWGTEKKADEFVKGNFWQIGWDKDDEESAAKKTWASYPNIKIGDEFAIKGLGGRYDLVVYYVGKVISKSEDGILKLQKLDRPLFRGKGPQGANWFDTIVPVTNKAAIDAVFYGKIGPKEGALAAPFNEFFASFEEANQGFDLIKDSLIKFGVNPAEPEKDGRISLTLVGKRNRMRLNFADWGVLTFNPLSRGDKRLDFMCIKKLIPAAAQNTESDFEFSDAVDGQEFGSGTCAVPVLHDPESEENQAYLQSLELAANRFKNSKGSRWVMNHEPQVLQMVFDLGLRHKLLNVGLKLDAGSSADPVKGPNGLIPAASNTILYGPPGTGKTYKTIERAVQIIEPGFTGDHAAYKSQFDALRAKGQIEFITFHQSYSYEDFVEGLRPVIEGPESSEAAYEYSSGVFKRFAFQALFDCLKPTAGIISFDAVWKKLVEQTKLEPDKLYPGLSEKTSYRISLSTKGNLDGINTISNKTFLCSRSILEKVFVAKPENKHVTSSEVMEVVVRGCHSHFVAAMFNELKRIEKREFSGQRSTSDTIISSEQKEGIAQAFLEKNNAGTEAFKPASEWPHFVLVIDEINRGNISKILGELITLIEADKRLGAENSLVVTLPYTKHSFAVPGNLHILGTMNTDDKSIALVDVALRRRFEFVELRPDFTVCKKLSPQMREVLETLNRRICLRKDRDHQIGHSYFMKVADDPTFNRIFARHVIPLLQEYFYNDWDGLRFVLGEKNKKTGAIIVELKDGDSGDSRSSWQWSFEAGTNDINNVDFLKLLGGKEPSA